MLTRTFKKIFNIRDGELRISFFMQLYIFLIITVLLIVKPTVTALFLSGVGSENLPYGFLLVAAAAIIASHFYNKAVSRFSLRKVINSTILFFSLAFALLALSMHFSILSKWSLYCFYVLISLFAVLMTSQFWILANMVFNVREAKRLFGFIGAGAIAGGIFGGYLTTLISLTLGNKYSIFIAAILLLLCLPILLLVWKKRLRVISIYARRKRQDLELVSKTNDLQLIKKSNHLIYLASIVGVSVLVAKLVDFQFNDFAHKEIPNPDDLASFFGFWFSTFNVIALAIQLFITNKVLGYLGVTTSLLILPLSIAIGALLLLVIPELWVLVILKGVDGSFKQSLNKAATELSILPIPQSIKNQAKSFIDVVVDSIATGLAGFILIFVVKGFGVDATYVTALILLFLFAWLILIYKLRGAYFESFRDNLQSLIVNQEDQRALLKKETTVATAIRILTSGDEREILQLMDRLGNLKLKSLQQYIEKLLNHDSHKVKVAAIEQLYNYPSGTASKAVENLLVIKDDRLVLSALLYLFDHTRYDDVKIFRKYLDHPSSYIANAALLCLAIESSGNPKLEKQFDLINRINQQLKVLSAPEALERVEATAELLMTIAYARYEPSFYYIDLHLYNTNRIIEKYAIRAAGTTQHPRFIEPLIEKLATKKFRKTTIKSLSNYGETINEKLLNLEKRDILKPRTKRFLPRIVAHFKSQSSIKILYKFLSSKDIITRKESARALKKLHKASHKLRFNKNYTHNATLKEIKYFKNSVDAIVTLTQMIDTYENGNEDSDKNTDILIARESLLDIIYQQRRDSLNTIFNLFALRYNAQDIQTAYFGLKSKDTIVQANAIEFLDNLLHLQYKSQILPLLEHTILDADKDSFTATEQINRQSEFEMITKLMKNRGKRIKVACLHLIDQLEDKSYVSFLQTLPTFDDPDVQKLRERVLKNLV